MSNLVWGSIISINLNSSTYLNKGEERDILLSNYFKKNELWNLKCQRHASSVMYPSHSPALQIGFAPGETELRLILQ